MLIGALIIVGFIAALAYIIHERLDLARFNKQARSSDAAPSGSQEKRNG